MPLDQKSKRNRQSQCTISAKYAKLTHTLISISYILLFQLVPTHRLVYFNHTLGW